MGHWDTNLVHVLLSVSCVENKEIEKDCNSNIRERSYLHCWENEGKIRLQSHLTSVFHGSEKMHEFSTIDGFVEISECMADMLKYLANEPSTGLFFIQHHTQNSVPNLIKVKRNLAEKSHETTLHREDMEDSIIMVRSMQKCVFPIADEMIGEIKKSLATMTTKQPKVGLIHQLASSSQTERASFRRNTAFYAHGGNEKRSNYFSNVLKSAKQKASSFKWSQLDGKGSIDSMGEKPQMCPNFPVPVTSASISSSVQDTEIDELPVSIQVEDESQHEQIDTSDIANKLLSVSGDIGSKVSVNIRKL